MQSPPRRCGSFEETGSVRALMQGRASSPSPRRAWARLARGSKAVLLATLVGCAGYRSVPLPTDTGTLLRDLRVPASTLLPGGLQTHPFDPSDGLDMTEVSMIAIAQSPDLRVQRAKAGVTRAQAFAAGLLPDPVFSMSRDQPSAGQVGATTAYTQGLSWDIGPLVTLAARRTAGRHAIEQVDLDLLWSEWQ